ncbi:alpha-latrotoxin associated low molecular weight protein SGV150-311-like [Parasteatoda tepidariorum]|uniref:alpha-latrotoxin associated low molecular weight protein SGV150-311-like n=1 Tax=Parasteatoda tepidariorum TaxID=114398 RepID=UPI00077F994C|nr:alpha-latrotoxin associated low molecular weight protein SGV150-311-like [Parasteatoda tepidariorum]XP_021002524.1 alpha-latrotoxin associated low molecular weight protein SGV150-311-like [Parasteatoda tepidariorum]
MNKLNSALLLLGVFVATLALSPEDLNCPVGFDSQLFANNEKVCQFCTDELKNETTFEKCSKNCFREEFFTSCTKLMNKEYFEVDDVEESPQENDGFL